MDLITYSLLNSNGSSEEYYSDIHDFTNETLNLSEPLLPTVRSFMQFINLNNIEPLRDESEYLLELLSFGVLWQTYAHIALSVKHAPFGLLSNMAEWRKKHQKLKPYIDHIRGVLISYFLLPEKKHSVIPAPPPTLNQLEHVYKWFMATGEFREQALRFINWRNFWKTRPQEEVASLFREIESLTFRFKENAANKLSKYTINVNTFITKNIIFYRWREDRLSCMKSEIEYHLNMVGADIMNRAFAKQFNETDKKAVLVPGCMRIHVTHECKAIKVPGGLQCIGCNKECKVNELRINGMKNNYLVFIIPHASDLSLWSPAKRNDNLGVVASACLTTLVEGGWELKRYGVPAQCVVLDYCGCKKHWHPTGFPTQFNYFELNRRLMHI